MFGYDDPLYGKDHCLVYGKEFWAETSPLYPTIAYNALVFITIFSIWRGLFGRLIESQAIQFANVQLLKKGNKDSLESNKNKYCESYWKTITNALLMFYGFYAIWYESPQFWDPSLLFESWPQPMNPTNLNYYRLAIGYHGHRAIYGLFWEKKRVDWIAYVIHHWVTVLLVVFSWCCGLAQHGIIVMALHDSADVLLSASKTLGYQNRRTAVTVVLAVFTVSWIVCRLTLYPLKVIYPALVYKHRYDCHPLYWLFVVLVFILLALHWYWFKHLLLHFHRIVTKPKTNFMHDPRSDDDNDRLDDHEHEQ